MTIYAEKRDEELLDLLKTDDDAAFTALYSRYWDKLFAVAYHRIDNEHVAEEIVQDVFLGLWKRRMSLCLKHTLATYLAVAVKYQIVNRLAKEQVRKTYMDKCQHTAEATENPTEQWLSEKELLLKLEPGVNQLPEKCRLVFQLSRNDGKSTKQIARELNIAEKTVEAHMTKALSKLRNSLDVPVAILYLLLNR